MEEKEMKDYHDVIVAFHEGRGGRYHNPGHLKYLPDVKCLQDLYDDSLYIVDIDQDDNKLPIEEHVLLDSGGNEILHGKDIYEKTGVLDIDGIYDTYTVCKLDYLGERFDRCLIEAIKKSEIEDSDKEDAIIQYLNDSGYNPVEEMSGMTRQIFEELSKFADANINPYKFKTRMLDRNEKEGVRLIEFSIGDWDSCCLMYDDGTVLTMDDWQSTCYPSSLDEVEDYDDTDWIDCNGIKAVMLNGLPRIMK